MKKGRCALTPQARMTATPSRLCPGLDTMWPGYRPHALGGPCKRLAYTPTFPSRVVCSLQPPPTGRWGGRERRGRGPRPAAQGFRTWLPSGSPWPRHPQPSRRETAPLGPGQRWKGSRKSGCARMGGGTEKGEKGLWVPICGLGVPSLGRVRGDFWGGHRSHLHVDPASSGCTFWRFCKPEAPDVKKICGCPLGTLGTHVWDWGNRTSPQTPAPTQQKDTSDPHYGILGEFH